jgi:hypothetical protein
MGLGLAQKFPVRRHNTVTAGGNALEYLFLRTAVEPDIIGKVGRSQGLVALAVRPVANSAILVEDLFALIGDNGIHVTAADAAHIFRHLENAIMSKPASCPVCRS